jgi:hypothetical protein
MALEAPGDLSAIADGIVNRGHRAGFNVILGVADRLTASYPGTPRSHISNDGRVV